MIETEEESKVFKHDSSVTFHFSKKITYLAAVALSTTKQISS